MKKTALITLVLAALISTKSFAEDQAHSKSHSHSKAAKQKLKLNKGKKWSTDSPLRTNMDSIHAELKKNLDPIHANKFTAAQFNSFGTHIESKVQNIFKSCKLPPKADAQLHIILIDLMQAKDILKTKKTNKEYHEATVKVLTAVQNYEKFFNHKADNHKADGHKHKKK